MSFEPSNRKLRNKDAVVAALEALNETEGSVWKLTGDDMPINHNPANHYQGVAIPYPRAIVTTSVHPGYLIISEAKAGNKRNKEFHFNQKTEVQGFHHPGGIQTIGDCVVVPLEQGKDKGSSAIRFYNYQDGFRLLDHLTITRKNKTAAAIGIANCTSSDGECYLLAVSYKNNAESKIDFYKSKPGYSLTNESEFQWLNNNSWPRTWREGHHRKAWHPNNAWRDCLNAISLIADQDGQVYLLGLSVEGYLLNMTPFGRDDYAALYQVDLTEEAKDKMLTKLTEIRIKNPLWPWLWPQKGAQFRWGGSALVTGNEHIKLFACERDLQVNNDRKELRLRIFHAADDPVV